MNNKRTNKFPTDEVTAPFNTGAWRPMPELPADESQKFPSMFGEEQPTARYNTAALLGRVQSA